MTRGGYGESSPVRTQKRTQRGVDSLSKRPAPEVPTSAGAVPMIRLYSWNYDTVNTVPESTWTNVCGLASSDGYFESVFHSNDWTTGWNFDAGSINMAQSWDHILHGWVQFWEDGVDGEQRWVALNFGSSLRHVQEYVADADSYLNLALHLPVHTAYFGTATVGLEVWHEGSGGDLTIRGAELAVYRILKETDGTIEDR